MDYKKMWEEQKEWLERLTKELGVSLNNSEVTSLDFVTSFHQFKAISEAYSNMLKIELNYLEQKESENNNE